MTKIEVKYKTSLNDTMGPLYAPGISTIRALFAVSLPKRHISDQLINPTLSSLYTFPNQSLDLSNEPDTLLYTRTSLWHGSNPRSKQVLQMRPIFRDLVLGQTWPKSCCAERHENNEHCARHTNRLISKSFQKLWNLEKTYESEQIQVSTKTVCPNDLKFEIWSQLAVRHRPAPSIVSIECAASICFNTISTYGR